MILLMEMIFIVVFAHYVLDYPLQGEFLAMTKGKNAYSLLAHSVIYGFGMGLVFMFFGMRGGYGVVIGLFITWTHVVIDYKKATAVDKDKALTTYLYIDQALHHAINIGLVVTVWKFWSL